MLKDILHSIDKTGYISRSQLATDLNVSKEVVDDGILQLLRMGYLIEDKTSVGCAEYCGKCPFAKSCNKDIIKTFRLSDEAIKKIHP
ncbi:MAG: FeoC-like transcriptional regulator [Anaerovoracaceae bacterium]|jgi:hypothetical protein